MIGCLQTTAEVCSLEGLFALSASLANELAPHFTKMQEVLLVCIFLLLTYKDLEVTAGMLSVKASRTYTNSTSVGFSRLSIPSTGSIAGAAVDTHSDRLTEAWVLKSWLQPVPITSSLLCPCFSEWHTWCTRYYSSACHDFLFLNLAIDPDIECVPCNSFCIANRVLALGEEMGTIAPFNYEFDTTVTSWNFVGNAYGRLWLSPFGTLKKWNITYLGRLGDPEMPSRGYSLVTPENDPTKEVVWTEPYFLESILYTGILSSSTTVLNLISLVYFCRCACIRCK